jgi:hypothetical protein
MTKHATPKMPRYVERRTPAEVSALFRSLQPKPLTPINYPDPNAMPAKGKRSHL